VRAAHCAACAGHKSLSFAGDVVHDPHKGASQVPDFFVGTFQSQSNVARFLHLHLFVGPQTNPAPPL